MFLFFLPDTLSVKKTKWGRGKGKREKSRYGTDVCEFAVAVVYKQVVLFQKLILNYLLRIAYYFWLFFGVQSGPEI